MGVRDYLDKNQDLNRETFLAAVRKQLTRIAPAKRHRELHQSLVAFRSAVEKVVPLVQSAATLNDPVPLPLAVASLCRFLRQVTGARDGVLLVRHQGATDEIRAYDAAGEPLPGPFVPFARSLAASAASVGEPCVMNRLDEAGGTIDLQPFERGRSSLLAAPLAVGAGINVVVELFNKPAPGFTDDDRKLAAAATEIGAELLKQALAERQTQRTLFDAVAAALTATDTVTARLDGARPDSTPDEPPPRAVMDRLRAGLKSGSTDAAVTLELAEAIRALAARHGEPAVRHCVVLVEGVRALLDEVAGGGADTWTR
jgi:hypothetical protein